MPDTAARVDAMTVKEIAAEMRAEAATFIHRNKLCVWADALDAAAAETCECTCKREFIRYLENRDMTPEDYEDYSKCFVCGKPVTVKEQP